MSIVLDHVSAVLALLLLLLFLLCLCCSCCAGCAANVVVRPPHFKGVSRAHTCTQPNSHGLHLLTREALLRAIKQPVPLFPPSLARGYAGNQSTCICFF